jgi:hypothetical protein
MSTVRSGSSSFHIDRMAQAVSDAIDRKSRPAGSAVQIPGMRLRFGTIATTSPLSITFGDGVNITQTVFRDNYYAPTENDWVAIITTDENLYFVLGKSVS